MKHYAQAIASLLLLACCISHATADDSDLGQTVEHKLSALFSALDPATHTPAQDIEKAADDLIDFVSITRGVLGKNKSALNDQQTARFQVEFEKSIINLLSVALTSAGSVEIAVTNIKMKNARAAQVLALITTPDQETFELLSSMALANDVWKVRNLIINGVNLGLVYRNQFADLMKTHGNDADAAIDAWAIAVGRSNSNEFGE